MNKAVLNVCVTLNVIFFEEFKHAMHCNDYISNSEFCP